MTGDSFRLSMFGDKRVEYTKNGPMMQEIAKPQLMLVRHKATTFMKNKKRNEEINNEFMREWRKKHPQKLRSY